MSTVGQYARWSVRQLLATSVTTIEAIKCGPQREVTGEMSTTTDRSTSYPGGGASRQTMAVTSRPARSDNNHENRADEQENEGYARDLDSCIPAHVAHVAREGSLRQPKTP